MTQRTRAILIEAAIFAMAMLIVAAFGSLARVAW